MMRRSLVPIIALFASGGPALAAEDAADAWVFGPVDTLYPEYVADPHLPRLRSALMVVGDSDLEDEFDVGNGRIALDAGARVPFFRRRAGAAGPVGDWQLTIDAAIFSQFDNEHSLDSIGWDGWLAAHVEYRLSDEIALKGAFRHVSAHRGDEFIERTGAGRIDYTREDFSLAAAYVTPFRVTVYGEVGYGVTLSDNRAFQEPWLIQVGVQERVEPGPDQRFGYQWGIESRWWEEHDWDPTLVARAALLIPMQGRERYFRVEAEVRDGRSALGEFALYEERSFLLGIAVAY